LNKSILKNCIHIKKSLKILFFIIGVLPLLYYYFMFGSCTLSNVKEDIEFFYEYFNNIYTPLLALFAGIVVYLTYQNQLESNKIQTLSSVYEFIKALLLDLDKWMENNTESITSNSYFLPSARITEQDIHIDFGSFRIYFNSLIEDSKIAVNKFELIEGYVKNFSPNSEFQFSLELYKYQLTNILNSLEIYKEALFKLKNLINDNDRTTFNPDGNFIKKEKSEWLNQIQENILKVSKILKK
jgi:hypothetical protein